MWLFDGTKHIKLTIVIIIMNDRFNVCKRLVTSCATQICEFSLSFFHRHCHCHTRIFVHSLSVLYECTFLFACVCFIHTVSQKCSTRVHIYTHSNRLEFLFSHVYTIHLLALITHTQANTFRLLFRSFCLPQFSLSFVFLTHFIKTLSAL